MTTPTSCTRWTGARWVLFILALLSVALPAGLRAQGGSDPIENSAGTSFVVAFPDTTRNTFDVRYPNNRYEDKCFFFIYSAVDNKISINGQGYSRNGLALGGGRFTIVDLMGSDMKAPSPICTDECKPSKLGVFRIEAASPIIVYQYIVTKFGTEAWTAIPVEAWGSEYYAAAAPGEVGSDVSPGGEWDYNRKNKMFPAEITVIAAYNDTKISIIPNGQIHQCNQLSVTLQAGEAYQVQSWVDTLTANLGTPQPDLGGSRIYSDKPVGVISGNTRAQVIDEVVGLGKNIFKNMMIEWVPPVDQNGTQFVYMPTWDARRPTGSPNEDLSEKRKAEFVRVYGTHPGVTSGYYMQAGAIINYNTAITQGKFEETRHTPNQARVHYTDQPAQAMMHSSAVVKYAGTTQGYGGYIGAAYDGWGPYSVEMTPREQWVDFAPYYASSHPAGMEHYINLVTDTAHANDIFLKGGANFVFNHGPIEGTDLTWGTMSVSPGLDNWIEGKNGAKFYGFVYGTLTKGGHEEYRPGRVKGPPSDDNPPTGVAGNGGGDDGGDKLMHPSEYEEYLGISYGYPLAPSRLVVAQGDSLEIKTRQDCIELTIEINSLSETPVGLRSVRLDNADNAKIYSQNPFPITGAVKATVVIRPINRRQNAHATVVIKDRSGKITTVPYDYYAEVLEIDPAELAFGVMTPGTSATKTATVRNPMDTSLAIKNIRLARGDQGFRILSPTSFPITIPAKGGTIPVQVEANPTQPDRDYVDTLWVIGQCDSFKIVVRAETANPCIYVSDLDFGVLAVGSTRTMPLRICNNGGGEVKFNNPSGGKVVEWILTNFTVSDQDIQTLANSVLARGQCVTIQVSFRADAVGAYMTTARFWANTRNCRDTSVWTARVTAPGPQVTPYDWDRRWLTTNNTCTKNTTPEYATDVDVYNTGTADFRIDRVYITGPDAAYFRLGTSPDPALQQGDLIKPSTQDPPEFQYPQRVYFFPDAERTYTAEIVVVAETGAEARGFLRGTGIESHVTVQEPNDFGRWLWSTGMAGVPKTIVITAPGTRDLHISDVHLLHGTDFFITTPASAYQNVTLAPGDALPISVEYRPQLPNTHTDSLIVVGDHSKCDDSVASMIGRSYVLSSTATGESIGEVLTCYTKDGVVTFRNTGNDPVKVWNIAQGGDPGFTYTLPNVPLIVLPDAPLLIPVNFAPTTVGAFRSTLTFTVTDTLNGDTVYTPQGTPIVAITTGEGAVRRTDARISRQLHDLPGRYKDVEVTIDNSMPDAKIDTLTYTLKWPHGMMQIQLPADPQDFVAGTPLQGWKVWILVPPSVDNAPIYGGRYSTMTLGLKAPAGQFLNVPANSVLTRVKFRLFVGDTTGGELPFYLTASTRENCAIIESHPGLIQIDSVCGLNFRLISSFETIYTLKPATPNPFHGNTDIRFSLGLDGQTRLSVYDANGVKVATLVDSYLNPGEYTVTWDPGNAPSGLYYYRLESGAWTRTATMMLQK